MLIIIFWSLYLSPITSLGILSWIFNSSFRDLMTALKFIISYISARKSGKMNFWETLLNLLFFSKFQSFMSFKEQIIRFDEIRAFLIILVNLVPFLSSKSFKCSDFSSSLQFLTKFYKGSPILDYSVYYTAFYKAYCALTYSYRTPNVMSLKYVIVDISSLNTTSWLIM